MKTAGLPHAENAITIVIPLTVRKRGGRKLVVVPEGVDQWAPARPRIDNTLIKAVARAFRWKALLDSGQYASWVNWRQLRKSTVRICRAYFVWPFSPLTS